MKREDILQKMNENCFKINIDGQKLTGVVLQEGAKGYWMIADMDTRKKFFNIPSKAIKVDYGCCPNPWLYA